MNISNIKLFTKETFSFVTVALIHCGYCADMNIRPPQKPLVISVDNEMSIHLGSCAIFNLISQAWLSTDLSDEENHSEGV